MIVEDEPGVRQALERGLARGGFDTIAPAVESVLNEQLNRLKLFAETGKPTSEQ